MRKDDDLTFATREGSSSSQKTTASITEKAPDPQSLEFVPGNYFAPIRLDELFARPAPLEVDVGCGEGAFLVATARCNPQRNFIGIERLVARVRKVCRRAMKAELTNVRVLCVESSYTVRYLLPPESVSVFHVMFPDPWPKRKHRERRLISREFLDAAYAGLCSNGEIRLTTDDIDYFEHMQKVTAAYDGFSKLSWPTDSEYPQTDFEKRFRARGLPIHRLRFRKI